MLLSSTVKVIISVLLLYIANNKPTTKRETALPDFLVILRKVRIELTQIHKKVIINLQKKIRDP